MKYTKEITDRMVQEYQAGVPTTQIALDLDVPDRSVIAKLSSLGVYQAKSYLNKRGEVPIRKSEQIQRIADLLNTNVELLESLEKVNKSVLHLLELNLSAPDPKPVQIAQIPTIQPDAVEPRTHRLSRRHDD